jgi:iron complex outermembrane receptor protein
MSAHNIGVVLCALSAYFCNAAFAQPGAEEEALSAMYGDDEMVSIATGSKQPIAKSPAVTTVITATEIRAMGATDIDDALETVPGLHVARNAFGYSPVYTFRGIYAQYNPQVLMLINGIPITNLFQGDRNLIWGGMPVNAIARIEVIRGPGSALYGADAFAGTINIITKTRADLPSGEIGARAGSFNTRSGWALHGMDIGEVQVALMLEYRQTDGQREKIDTDAQTGLDAVFGTHASLAPGSVELSGKALDLRLDTAWHNWRLRAGLQQRRDIGSGAGVAEALDANGRYGSERWNLDLTYDHFKLAEAWNLTAQLSVLNSMQEIENDLQIFPPGVNLGAGVYPNGVIGNPDVFERHYRADVTTLYTGLERHQWRTGVGYYYGDMYKVRETKNFGLDPATGLPLPSTSPVIDVSGTPYVFLTEGSRSNRYGYLQDVWSFIPDWELTAGLRYDDYSDFGHTLNPRLALVWSTTRKLTSKVLYGRAFRSPSFAQMRNANNPALLGNDKLDPETIKTFELAFDYRPLEKLHLGFNLFHYDWDNIIQLVPEPNSTAKRAQNAGNQIGNGGEFELSWQTSDTLKLNANYAYQKSRDKTLDAPAANAPQQHIYAAANWAFAERWQLHTQINWVLDRQRDARDGRPPIDDYSTVDLTLRHSLFAGQWSVALLARNLFNSSPREPSLWSDPAPPITNDLPLARRNFTVELTCQIP